MLAWVIVTLGVQGPAAAQGRNLAELSLDDLASIQVTSAAKQPESVWDTPMAIHVISREDIRRSGATSIPEILRLAPGVEVARIDSGHWAVGVRGFSDQFSKSLLVLVDGRSIYTPLFAGIYWPVHDTLIEDIERVEIIRGPGGTIWGANAVNGVINIITRTAADTSGALVSAGAGSRDRFAAFRYGGAVGTSGHYRLYAMGTDRGSQVHGGGDAYDTWWTMRAGARTDWTRASDRVTLQGEISRGDHGQRIVSTSVQPPFQRVVDGALDANGAHVLARWARDLGASAGLQVQAYWDRTDWKATHFEETRDTFDVDMVHNVAAGAHAVTWGAGARRSPGTFRQTITSLTFEPARQTASVYSVFLQDEVRLVRDRLWLTGGAKIERHNYTGVEVQPAGRVLWRVRPTQTLWSAVTRAVRTPSRIERDMRGLSYASSTAAGVPIFLEVAGSRGVDAERLTGYEIGYRAQPTASLHVDVAAFHNEHRDLASFGLSNITLEPGPPLHVVARIPFVNGVEGTSDGFEISPDWQPLSRMQVKGSYSYVDVDLATTPASIDPNAIARYQGSSPRHQVRLQVHALAWRGAELDAGYRYVDALPFRGVESYHEANLRVAIPLRAGVEVAIRGENLLQPRHAEFAPSVSIGRQVLATVAWRAPGR